ncbi:MAG: Crp/Fnr family transcriptional regulator [Bacteroidales bacterium]|jgi:CRP-like cAMP-binding protein|nr:Crp/Fnr family transcriptional regulator [Bacteroidales bacterium]HOL98330.1 Crp/Fnr family transcriptional regulator [Bacteroidales bacterium]HOM35732.1 Crp/Fnr family transcriptional regulator [Bacteroidales bacterium]HPD23128.1 Crp/Fnr family transcriptional regulator [Bacteroidales bacterium]HRS99057.1 Crp/Fnr family transcriptional regulator [Bacteroidales bacterium]
MFELLQRCNIFNNFRDIKEIEDVFNGIFYNLKTYTKDEILAYQDDEVNSLKIIIEGTARGDMTNFNGKLITIEEIESVRMLAPAFLFGKNSKYPVTIVAATDVKILNIPKNEFVKMMHNSEKLMINFMNELSSRAQFLSQKIKFLSFHDIKAKFAYYILNLIKNKNTNTVRLPITQDKLAELFGVTRPSLARAIREMHNDRIINARAKEIEILDSYRLYDLIK